MIARIWHGETGVGSSESYRQYLERTGVADYLAVPGVRGVMVLRRMLDDRIEWLTISLWDSVEAIRAFAGEDIDRAVYYPGDADHLLAFEPTVRHYRVIYRSGGEPGPTAADLAER